MFVEIIVVSSLFVARKVYRGGKATKKGVTDEKKVFSFLKKRKLISTSSENIRQQQLTEITKGVDVKEELQANKKANQNLTISLGSLGVSTVGAVIYPPLALLSVPAIIYAGGLPIYTKTYQELKQGKIGTNALSAITITGCLSLGYFVVGSALTSVYCLSKKLLLKVQSDSKKSLIDVFKQHPRFVWVLTDGKEIETAFEDLKLGDIVVVQAGEMIPADGIITDGIALVDQHILTGEAQPAEKEVGQEVFASTIILSGQINFKIEKAGEETVAAKIGDVLNNITDFKAATQLKAEKIADKTAIPTLIASGLSIPLIGPYGALAILNAHFKYRLSVIAPISIMNHLNLASKSGVLIKDGRTLELLNEVDTIVFDKTGTLTKEEPHVGAIHTCAEYDEKQVLTFTAAAEYKQTHPLAKAILKKASEEQLELPSLEETEYKIGYGLTVTINNQLVQVGSIRFMELAEIPIPEQFKETIESCYEEGHSLVFVAIDSRLIGAVELCPTVRPEAKKVIEQLQQFPNIKSIYIISGDDETPTKKLAGELGIENYFAETLPENKGDLIEQLQNEGKFICYIGDGINDSIALKKSQVSISLRGASTVATDTAQVVLMDESLEQLVGLFELAKKFEANMHSSFMYLLIPTMVGIGGVLFLNLGLIYTLILTTTGLTAGVINAMLPVLKNQNESFNHIGNNNEAASLPAPTVASSPVLSSTKLGK
jgi:Cu2+-exporting ATPase